MKYIVIYKLEDNETGCSEYEECLGVYDTLNEAFGIAYLKLNREISDSGMNSGLVTISTAEKLFDDCVDIGYKISAVGEESLTACVSIFFCDKNLTYRDNLAG